MSEDKNRVRDLVNVYVTKLGNDEHDSVLFDCLHENWEVTCHIRWDLNVNASLELLTVGSWVSDFHEVDLLGCLSCFLLTETENGVLVEIVLSDGQVGETTSVSLNELLLALLCEEELHVSIDVLLIV